MTIPNYCTECLTRIDGPRGECADCRAKRQAKQALSERGPARYPIGDVGINTLQVALQTLRNENVDLRRQLAQMHGVPPWEAECEKELTALVLTGRPPGPGACMMLTTYAQFYFQPLFLVAGAALWSGARLKEFMIGIDNMIPPEGLPLSVVARRPGLSRQQWPGVRLEMPRMQPGLCVTAVLSGVPDPARAELILYGERLEERGGVLLLGAQPRPRNV